MPKKSNYIQRVALVMYPRFYDDLNLDGRPNHQMDHLLGDDGLSGLVPDAVQHAAIASP